MAKLLANVEATRGYDLVPVGWYPIAISNVGWGPVKKGKSVGSPRLALEYSISEGPCEGRKLFDGGMPGGEGVGPGILRARLETLASDTDWGDFDFPDGFQDADGIERLKEALIGAEGYALVRHTVRDDQPPDPTTGERPMSAKVVNVAGPDADVVLAYEE